MHECVYYGGADTEACERTGAGHEGDFGDILPICLVFL